MSPTQSDPDPTPVPPPPIESNPSATGVIDGEEAEVEPARPVDGAEES
jgi:hypothetical protein